ncbi:MAG TPA: UDP-3-O-(3-hydroxymyristoyl)glucosamine N-acyltransferase [Gemmatimonadaceae bacterium]|nr:UDP-3-O-(3-hydroxymyristoyl)glucosamine N-acyltransferase [Gemmatimonadaceae bacterium]
MTQHATASGSAGGEGAISFSAAALARLVGGVVRGDGSHVVTGIAPLDRAEEHHLSLLATAGYREQFASSRAGAILVCPELADSPGGARCRIVVERPAEALLGILPQLYPEAPSPTGIHNTAILGRGVKLGAGVSIGPYTVVGDGAALGDGVTIGPHCVVGAGVEVGVGSHLSASVTLSPGTRLGQRVRVYSGARLGGDGFGYVLRDGAHAKLPHVGQCLIGDDVDIGANTTIDRGSIDDTVIGAGTKIDNLVHIAHNVRIGRNCLLMAQVGIAGSVHIGDGCLLAGQVGVSGHHTIGDGARLSAQAGVFGDIPAGETWSGYPARPHREMLRAHAALFRLASMMKRIEQLLTRAAE